MKGQIMQYKRFCYNLIDRIEILLNYNIVDKRSSICFPVWYILAYAGVFSFFWIVAHAWLLSLNIIETIFVIVGLGLLGWMVWKVLVSKHKIKSNSESQTYADDE